MNIKDNLKNISKSQNVDYNMISTAFILERMVARIASSPKLSKKLIIKGGFLLFKTLESERFTVDLDALGKNIDADKLKREVPSAMEQDLNDEVSFFFIKAEDLKHIESYEGIRFVFAYRVGKNAKGFKSNSMRIHFDIGFGDSVPQNLNPVVLKSIITGISDISCLVYPLEYVFSEKVHALFSNSSSSRSKDVYDITIIKDKCEIQSLKKAITATFLQRNTDVPSSFHLHFSERETDVLEASWKSVRIPRKQGFDFIWGKFLTIMDELDKG